MIGKLKGIIDSYGEDSSSSTSAASATWCIARRARCRRYPERVSRELSIETHVRGDQIRLFGFVSDLEREWFRLPADRAGRRHQGGAVDPLHAQAADLASAIAMRDKAMITRAPGVGPKVAERVVTELKDKAPAYSSLDPAVVRLSGALEERRAPRPVAARRPFLGAGQSRLRAAAGGGGRRRRAKAAGEGAEQRC